MDEGVGEGVGEGAGSGGGPAVSLVVARAENGVIGRDNRLPWRLPADLGHFKRLTLGRPVVMGRRTFESIGKPLPGRRNVVVSRTLTGPPPGVEVVASLPDALLLLADAPEVMVIGGARLFAEAAELAARVHLTEVHASPDGDVTIPDFDRRTWVEETREAHPPENGRPGFSFVTLARR